MTENQGLRRMILNKSICGEFKILHRVSQSPSATLRDRSHFLIFSKAYLPMRRFLSEVVPELHCIKPIEGEMDFIMTKSVTEACRRVMLNLNETTAHIYRTKSIIL